MARPRKSLSKRLGFTKAYMGLLFENKGALLTAYVVQARLVAPSKGVNLVSKPPLMKLNN